MRLLKQNTAVAVLIGRFVDQTDGYTPETANAWGANEMALVKHGATAAVDLSGRTITHIAEGFYNVSLLAGDVDTLGMLVVFGRDAGTSRGADAEFMVVPANVWDSLVGGSDKLDVNVNQINENAASGFLSGTDHVKADVAKISGSAPAADNMEAGALGAVAFTVLAGSTATSVITDLTESTNSHYAGRTMVFTSGAMAGQAATVASYTGATKALGCAALTEVPAAGVTGVIV